MLVRMGRMKEAATYSRLPNRDLIKRNRKKTIITFSILGVLLVLAFFLAILTGSSNMNWGTAIQALFGKGDSTDIMIMQRIRLPRVLAGLIAGAGLALAGHVMQSSLRNPMADPSTLGVSNAAVLGANVALIVLGGGIYSSNSGLVESNPYLVTGLAFLFSLASILLILGLSSFRKFESGTVILAGIAMGALWSALTTLIQYFASDTALSGAVYWTFGDLGRASFTDDWILLGVCGIAALVFFFFSPAYNAISGGEDNAKSLGINVSLVRFISLLLASLVTAVCVSFLGIIGFLGIMAPHLMKRIIGRDHRISLPASALTGSILLLFSDTLARSLLQGTALPVGAITALLGAPFFLYVVFSRKEASAC